MLDAVLGLPQFVDSFLKIGKPASHNIDRGHWIGLEATKRSQCSVKGSRCSGSLNEPHQIFLFLS